MRKAAFSLPILALALLGACGSIEEKATPVPVVVTTPPPAVVTTTTPAVVVPQAVPPAVVAASPVAVRAGAGRIESVAALPPNAAAGGTAARRIGVKMDDGTMQFLDTSALGLAIGDRIEITAEGNIRR
jgi:hypothetical protein